ncbi:MAG: DNA polymerase III subunit delta' [endosymbiont of Galathealinum brachiosum]|uniref:DNA polymerase III subunit delta' n=1 Tax=endosymbiont of Galathealinum brachiosum TaxID=2200906 RepID=A0A370DMP7_9GAMM|nr:MAG: DNA polymerase III subunit delta' [endosymbiont of Galathealinum brachiosum]
MLYPWQQSQWQKIQQQKLSAKLPHALLMSGPLGLGKLDFALHLAHSLLCQSPDDHGIACGKCASCQLVEAETHPDLFILQAEERGKAIKVDDVRQLSSKLNLTSQYGGYQVALIVDAHDMNINASNSLLKTLEEPSSDTVLILVSSNPQKLPVTIRSRCQNISFNVPESQQALSWLESQNIQQANALLNLAHGAPLLALDLQQGELLDHHKLLINSLLNVAKNQPVIEQAELLHKLPLNYLLNWLFDWVQDLIKLHQCGDSATLIHTEQQTELKQLVTRSSLQGLYDYLDQLVKNKQLQSIPLNSQLLWEDLLLSWYKTLKRV